MALLNRKSQPSEGSYPDTVVSSGMRIEGELKSMGNIKIDGIVSGKVHTSQDLEVGPNAQIEADLIANNALVAGIVKGNITVKHSVQITDTGKVLGNVSCNSLSIHDGAYFNGACRMQEPKKDVAVKVEEEEEN